MTEKDTVQTLEEEPVEVEERVDAPDQTTAKESSAATPREGAARTPVEDAQPANGSPYDFTRPWTISNKFHNNLTSISDALANQLSFTMSNYLRTTVDVVFKRVKQELFKDYTASLPQKSCNGIFVFQPLKGQCVLSVDARLMFVIMEKLIGGAGKGAGLDRDFTEIETRIFMAVLNKMLGDLREASKKYFEATSSLSRIESNPTFIAAITPAEKVISIRHEMTIGETKGDICIAMPMAGFDPVLASLDPKDELRLGRADIPPEDREKIQGALADSTIEVRAVLGSTEITLQRLLSLEMGDTIILAHRMNEPIPLKAGRTIVGYGEPGKSQNRKAVKLVSNIKPEV